ncbi:transcriptional regulator, MarR/EmrR family protein [Clostridium pasteurianum DSM 525 = ATCC 6013]|uniref:Transcriptional regulator, MarR family n=1 Tax=Clostridium pasteurianum DSM 525 = ATCC 6013 TaxID=1262449 RepID=A0A0H3J7L2_CLOPA|nr:MarR family transcriptional regulator [Clostridium pasteurianum]AJA49906.1 transcriptional regulator, MarR/EmrR family protein [Clostridium pasteurianum DSM 525 = ATCC 6013]AJA53894.1 transcriptional regulator, MarR/EmrR family protein [Clostridium pasteurianum DSM 525 = ATCC 6013]AOZ77044.1 MarR family transcriptional regulator [Clostridium pasteurianum DSM 525 = ATCC 6013]AOZ80841.1 MarR family transcriptional regulator [Clostridium pasteurianum]ELP57864.1 Transcriptional regulator, MarR/
MLKDNFAFIANYLWRESIKNLNTHLSENELKNFSNNDYYYLTTIYYLKKPNFSEIAEALGLTKPAISIIIKKLTKMDLIEKKQSDEDRRIYYVNLTEKGKKIVEGDEELYSKFDLLIKSLLKDDNQYGIVDDLLGKIVFKLEENRTLD